MQQQTQVTPCDPMPAAVAREVTPGDELKQVRFEEKKGTSSCVSKRGRYVSPGRRNAKVPEPVKSGDADDGVLDCSKDVTLLLSPKSNEKSYIATTPTADFTVDFGSSKGFDTSNVLAWLQSPSGLFSPGFGTSSKASTPVVSTSFFFSDVANLPKGSTENNIICISPLASSKQSASDWKEVFASPEAKVTSQPVRKGVDAVLSAERDVMEDEDLSVLLQLASNSTPSRVYRKEEKKGIPSIPLPMKTDSGKVKLSKKVSSSEEFVPPQLGMRPGYAHSGNMNQYSYPPPDFYGSMTVSIGNGQGPPPSPKQPYPYPPPMYPQYYQASQPYPYPTTYTQQPAPAAAAAAQPPKKKAKTESPEPVVTGSSAAKAPRKRGSPKKKNKSPQLKGAEERQKAASAIRDLNVAAGGKNDRAAALAAAILRGVTMRPSGKWQAQLYFAGKSRYIGVFDSREKAALAYEIAREKLKTGAAAGESTEALVNAARKAAFDGVNEQLK